MAAVPIERRKSCGVVIASFMALGGAALLHWPASCLRLLASGLYAAAATP
jgi:hypothetical protein